MSEMLKELSSRWCINSQETGAHRFALCRLCWNWQAHVAASTNTPPASPTPIDDPRIGAALARSDLALDTLKSEPVTVYLVLPPAKLTANTRFVRLFIGSAPAAISASSQQPAHKVVFFLDEFAQLGRLVAIEDAISLVRGYGAVFWIFVQDLSQLKAVYERWNTFLANSAKQFFGTADYDTAKYVSDSMSHTTIQFLTANESQNQGSIHGFSGGSWSSGNSQGKSQQMLGRPLLTPDEIMRLGSDQPLVLIQGEPPYRLNRLSYLTDPQYVGHYDASPYHV